MGGITTDPKMPENSTWYGDRDSWVELQMLEIYMAVETGLNMGFKPKQKQLGWADFHDSTQNI